MNRQRIGPYHFCILTVSASVHVEVNGRTGNSQSTVLFHNSVCLNGRRTKGRNRNVSVVMESVIKTHLHSIAGSWMLAQYLSTRLLQDGQAYISLLSPHSHTHIEHTHSLTHTHTVHDLTSSKQNVAVVPLVCVRVSST